MSTRSCIILKVRKEDLGKVKKFNEKLLPITLKTWKEEWCDESSKEKSEEVTLKKEYIGIYCHWDGYPSGVGAVLKEKFTDYDSILNLIVGGYCSSVWYDGIKHYANRKRMKWGDIKPNQGDTQKKVLNNYSWIEYAYLFDEERGGWLYKPTLGKNGTKNGFKVF